jgi:uroporphyrinogen-III decarboxylase
MSANSRELVRQTLEFSAPARIPRHIWLLPWAENKYARELARIQSRFPDDIVSAPAVYRQPLQVQGGKYTRGIYVDEWGCTFRNPQDGIIGIVHKPLVKDWRDVEDLQPPEGMLHPDKASINRFCRETDQFVLAAHVVRPFERLQFIRTMEQALMDLMEQPPELFELLKRMHTFYCQEVEAWAQTDVDAVALMDDWGTQQALLLHPDIFRQIFKPMYRDYVEIARSYGKYVFMHSDGHITEIIPDLIEVGIDSLNAQIFCMGVEELGRRFKGKITFWGEIDRQYLLVQGTEAEIEAAVQSVWRHMFASGGVIAQCEFGLEARPENVRAVFATWDRLSQGGGD